MVTQPQLPPSERDFEAYRLVKVQQKSTRSAAKLLGVSQTRVCQLIERAAEFLVEVAPGADDEEQRGRRLHVAEQVAAERVDFLYGQAVRSYKRSQGVHETIRLVEAVGKPAVTIGTTREDFGDSRILMAAARLALIAARLPTPMLGNGLRDGEVEEVAVPTQQNPPVEDCSPVASEQGVAATDANSEVAASLSRTSACMNEVLDRLHLERPRVAPVHLVEPTPASETDRSATDRPLNPRERRARESFLAPLS